jgi:glycosyltransferase involved in cell wall biosynthesis
VKPDVVQTWLPQMDVIGGLAALYCGTPWLLSERSSIRAYPCSLKTFARRYLARSAKAVIANSKAGDSYWESYLPPERRIIIQNGLPLKEIEHAERKLDNGSHLQRESQLILFVGRFSKERNIKLLLEALRRVFQNSSARAVFCGDGPLRKYSEDRAHAIGISERMTFQGNISDVEVWRWMKRASVMISISLFEGHPNAVTEAMACHCPLVVSDIPQHREILDEASALFVDPGSVEAVSAAVCEAVNNPKRSAERAEKAHGIAAQWTMKCMVQSYLNTYMRILGRTELHTLACQRGRTK